MVPDVPPRIINSAVIATVISVIIVVSRRYDNEAPPLTKRTLVNLAFIVPPIMFGVAGSTYLVVFGPSPIEAPVGFLKQFVMTFFAVLVPGVLAEVARIYVVEDYLDSDFPLTEYDPTQES